MRRNNRGQYRVNYFERFIPVMLMIWTATAGLGFKTSRYIVEARGGETLVTVDQPVKVHVSPTPTPQLQVIKPEPVIPTATPTPTTKEMIIAEIVRVFGEDAPDAFNVLYCENRNLRPDAENWNSNGTWDAGLFQVNQVHGYSLEQMKDYKKNIQAAKKIFDNRGWTAWACSERVGIKPFWK